MPVPQPTPIFRFIHADNLRLCLDRQRLCAPNHAPDDGRVYRTIHNVGVQTKRQATAIPCGPGGTIHDYVPFYFGYLSPMLLNLKTGRVSGYGEGQTPLIYLGLDGAGRPGQRCALRVLGRAWVGDVHRVVRRLGATAPGGLVDGLPALLEGRR